MHVLLHGFANLLSQKYIGFARIRKYDFAGFHKLSQAFTSFLTLSQICFAIFRKVSQDIVSQSFAKFRKVSRIDLAEQVLGGGIGTDTLCKIDGPFANCF